VLRDAILRAIDGPPSVSAPASPPDVSRSHTPMHLALGVMGGGQAADVLSTLAALHRSGAQEGNPVYGHNPSQARVIATKAAMAVPTGLLLDKMYNAHPLVAMLAALGIGGVGMGLAAHNAKAGR
jgi:hypothetical protein